MSYGRGGYTGSDRLPHGAPLPSSRSVSRLSLGSQQGSTRMGSSPLFNTREAGHTPFTEPPDSLPRYNNHPSHRRSSDSSQSLGFTRPNHGRASLNQGQVPHNSNFGTPAPGQRFPSQSHIVVPPNYRVQASPNLNRPTIYPHSPVTASFIPPAASMPNNRQPFPSQHDHNSAPSYGVHHNRAPQNGINYYPNSTPTRDPDVLGEERGAMRPETSHSHTAISQGPRIAALPSNDPQSLSQVHESRATPYDSMIELSWEQRKDLHNRVRFVKTLKGVVEEYRDKFHYPHHLDQYITEWGKPSYPHLDQVWLELAREYYDDLDADWLCNTTNKASASEHPGHWMAESSSTQIGLLSTWEFLKEKYKKYQSDSTAQKELSLYQYISRETQNNGRYPVTHGITCFRWDSTFTLILSLRKTVAERVL
ncbi:hypothetical protein C8R43DRAFT_501402 [Mycena crocata]|nr:hypothetical protein C8R43DRAFT_501402 [Mycena crocata]